MDIAFRYLILLQKKTAGTKIPISTPVLPTSITETDLKQLLVAKSAPNLGLLEPNTSFKTPQIYLLYASNRTIKDFSRQISLFKLSCNQKMSFSSLTCVFCLKKAKLCIS